MTLIPRYRYRVTVGQDEMMFCDVSGLQMESTTIEHNISLKRGILTGQSHLYEWFHAISFSSNRVEKKDVSISMLNEESNEAEVTWNVVSAYPIKLSAPNSDDLRYEVAIGELILLAEGVTIQFH